MKKNKKEIIQWVGRILSIVSIGFIVYAICKMGLDFSFVNNVPLFILVMGIGLILKVSSLWFSGTAWASWLSFFSRQDSHVREARRVFIRANIGKYIPGNVMHFVQRNLFAANMGVSQVQLAASSVFEVCSYVTVALLVSLLTARSGLTLVLNRYFGDKLPILGIAAACGLLAVAGALFLFRKKLKKALEGYSMRDFFLTLGKAMLLQLITLLLIGVVLELLVVYALGSFSWATVGTVLSAYIIAWVLGYIVPGASGGIGIREMALLLLLGPVIGESLILSLAVIHRLITVIGDFAGYLIVTLLNRKEEKANA